MPKFITAEEAVLLIRDTHTVAILGSGGGLCEPTSLLKALGDRYVQEQSPRDLTLFHCNGLGDKCSTGTELLAYEGLIRRDISGHWAMSPKLGCLALEEKIEAYNFPQGVLSQMYSVVAAKQPGVITKIGLHTFVDPRIEGGKMNKRTTEDLVKVINIEGEEWLFYPRHSFDIGLVRGTTADLKGNISFEEEAAILEATSICQAVKNCGGITIAQVKYVTTKPIPAMQVIIPGIYVDYIVVDKEQKQTALEVFNPALNGRLYSPLDRIPPLPMNERKIIARRAALEIEPGAIMNVGVGIPDGIAAIASEEGYLQDLHFSVEQGLVGGLPQRGVVFGCSHNPDAMISQTLQFNFYDGGGLDTAFLGMAQVDSYGNVNSSKTGKLLSGCGGAINISQNAKKVVFCGTFTTKGLKISVAGEKLTIIKEGSIKKLVTEVEQITFSSTYSDSINQPVLYITERAVFSREGSTLKLLEIAPGIDLEKDILLQMEFKPEIASNLKIMDSSLFR